MIITGLQIFMHLQEIFKYEIIWNARNMKKYIKYP